MPDTNNSHGKGSESKQGDKPLSDLISSTMESMGKKKTDDNNTNHSAEKRTELPEIKFEKADAPKKNDAAKKPEIPERKPAAQKPASHPTGKPANGGAKNTAAKNTPPKKPAQGSPKTAANKPAAAKRTAAKSTPTKPQAAKSAAQKNQKNTKHANRPAVPTNAKPQPKKPESTAKTAASGGAAAAKKFTKKQIATVVGLILSLLLVLVLVVVLLFNYYYGKLDTSALNDSVNSTPMTYSDVDLSRADTIDKNAEDEKLKELATQGEKISNEDVMNILLIGEDLRDTESGDAGNTDVMMIISINTVDKTITMTSIMRDCYVNYQDENGYWWSNRINAAYWTGGMSLTKQTIENYMNVEIDRYVLVNFKVFIDIVDTLGGIDMYVSDEEANGYPDADPYGDNTRGMQNPLDEQNKYLGNKKGTDYIEEGGYLHLNGNQALAYARLRHVGNSDYERTERQRKVITEIIKGSRELSIIEMDELANKILPQIKTDVTKAEAAQLLIDMLDYRNYEIQEFRVPADNTFTAQTINGMDVLVVDFNSNAEIFRELVYGTVDISESTATIE